MSNDLRYAFHENPEEDLTHKYFFESIHSDTGIQVIKAVEYSYATDYRGQPVFNLAFGDYDADKNEIIDDVLTSNGDTYKVFNTVMNLVPVFFEKFPGGILLLPVDSKEDYAIACRKNCSRNCENECRKQHRRINAYRYYINKNYESLSRDYYFEGGSRNGSQTSVSPYDKNVKYDVILVYKKKK